ncbi:MAG: helix-turn-helix domain-containing protein [Nocardioides sp.]|nr:helix-turn-helix domain-containing protein [Nocardioides sp.]
MSGRDTRRTELADFLRTRRERLTPEDVGLPAGGRRRTPGLRREEVAMLAGVGVTWYTWLEQGRDINASVQVLEAVARTLRMDAQERWHLFQLAGVTIVAPTHPCNVVSGASQEILDQLDPLPAVVVSARNDILAYNRNYNQMMGGLDDVDPGERNVIWQFFTNPHCISMCISNRAAASAHMVANLRAAMAPHVEDPIWANLVKRLREASTEFDEIWRRHDVVDVAMPAKDFRSPVGDLHLQMTRFGVGSGTDLRMNVYSPRDQETRLRLERLLELDRQRLQAV